ncbi:hypothetical protein CWI36_0256p0010 [Hamiltosporidium magnivora]|uniref:Uncharacterized protein n=2 Tax=Hamiltosporidium magnivora TaxID=148818 RepID=A0A4Q9LHN7_9MICR|nr:hypothetical protein CWI36_0256p0010 [Hamiltosporidium magnivora]
MRVFLALYYLSSPFTIKCKREIENEELCSTRNSVEIENITLPIIRETEEEEQQYINFIITNSYQDIIDNFSLSYPLIEKFFKPYLAIIKDLYEESLKDSIKAVTNSDELRYTNMSRKELFIALYQTYIEKFTGKYVQACKNSKDSRYYSSDFHKKEMSKVSYFSNDRVKNIFNSLKFPPNSENKIETHEEIIKTIDDITKENLFKQFTLKMTCKACRNVLIECVAKNRKVIYLEKNKFPIISTENFEPMIDDEVKRNKFLKYLKAKYAKNEWKFPLYYTDQYIKMHSTIEIENYYIKGLLQNFFFENFGDFYKFEMMTVLMHYDTFDDNRLGYFQSISERLKHKCVIFETNFVNDIPNFLRKFLQSCESLYEFESHRIIYLTLFLKIDDWLEVFIEDFVKILGEDKFKDVLMISFSNNKSSLITILEEIYVNRALPRPFCNEIDSIFDAIKNNIRLRTKISVHFHKVRDSIVNKILGVFCEEKQVANEIYPGQDTRASNRKIIKNILISFKYYFKRTINKKFERSRHFRISGYSFEK